MRAEDFFPLGWLDRPFRRQPYPDMTYEGALDSATIIAWNMGSKDSTAVWGELSDVATRMKHEHPDFPGRSQQLVAELNELWRGKVTTLLKWFQTKGAGK